MKIYVLIVPEIIPFREWTLGVVKDVGADWIELAAGWEGAQLFDSEGHLLTKKPDNSKPKRITAAGTTASGNPTGDGKRFTYLLKDLKKGDKIQLIANIEKDRSEWCGEVRILRRPGGKIPPKPGDGDSPLAWHLYKQAEQDWEEKGVPIPEKFLSDGRYPWTTPPYPPIAPIPRQISR